MKGSVRYVASVVLAVVLYLLTGSFFFTVPEGTQALITRFGEIQGQPIVKAGLHGKLPWDEVRYFDKRILTWNGDPEQIPTKDKKYIWVDTTARWRIGDLRKFAETVQTEAGARDRLNGILDGVTRDTISNHNLVEAVRNSNQIFEELAARKKAVQEKELTDGKLDIEEEVTGEIERIEKGREALAKLIIERARKELEPLGVELIDVQLRRIAYEKSVEDKVYDRMISERNRIAEKIRSIGKGGEARIRGTMNRDLKEIESEAYRKSQELKGQAESKAIAIYGGTIKQDPEYFAFTRTLDAYKTALGGKTKIVLTTDSEFLKYLKDKP